MHALRTSGLSQWLPCCFSERCCLLSTAWRLSFVRVIRLSLYLGIFSMFDGLFTSDFLTCHMVTFVRELLEVCYNTDSRLIVGDQLD